MKDWRTAAALTPARAAAVAGVSVAEIRRACHAGRLRHRQLQAGGPLRIDPASVAEVYGFEAPPRDADVVELVRRVLDATGAR